MENNKSLSSQNSYMSKFVKTDDILTDMRGIIDSAQKAAFQAVNIALVQRKWLLGYRIAEEELNGEKRAEYGTEVIKKLAKELTAEYGKGFDYSTLYKFVRFYKSFPAILDTVSPKSFSLLSWSHYRALLQVEDEKHATGMQRKRRNRHGACARCSAVSVRSIISVC